MDNVLDAYLIDVMEILLTEKQWERIFLGY